MKYPLHMLDTSFLQPICVTLAQQADCTISVMVDGGRIIASSLQERIGQIHPGAARIMRGEIDSLDITQEAAAGSGSMREGCNLAIDIDGLRFASIGVAAPLERAREFAPIVRTCFQAMLENQLRHQRNQQSLQHQVEERQLVEQALRRSREQLQTTLNSIGDGVIATDQEGFITHINPVASKLTGWPKAEAMDRRLQEVFQFFSAARPVPTDGGALRQQGVLHARNGREHPIAYTESTIRDANNQPLGSVRVLRDISEELAIRQALQQSEAQKRNLLDNTSSVIYIKDPLGHYQFINRRFQELFHIDSDEIVGKTDYQIFPLHLASAFRANDLKALEADHPVEFEETALQDDGEHIYLSVKFPLRDPRGKIYAVAGISTDISERLKARKALEQSEQRFRDFADIAADWFWEMGADLRFSYLSGRVHDVMGLHPEEVVGMNREELYGPFHDMNTPHWQRHLANIRGHQRFDDFRIDWHRPDGEIRHISLSGRPIVDDAGEFIGYRGIGRDLTETRQAEEQLNQLRNYLIDIIDAMPSVLIGVDRNERVTLWNAEAESVTGRDAAHALGEPLETAFPRLARERQRIRIALGRGEQVTDLKRPVQRAGQLHYENLTLFPIGGSQADGVIIRLDDVTEQVRLEEMMVQSEKMLSVGGLAAGMAHEINNPLAGMLQTAEVIRNRLSDPTIKANQRTAEALGLELKTLYQYMEQRNILKMLETFSDSGRRVAGIVNNMLSFARKSDSTRASHDLVQLVEASLELAATDYDLKKSYDFRSIEIQRQFQSDLPPLPCEAGKIQQVLLNLLRNSAQAMAECPQPRLLIRARHDGAAGRLHLEIEDNGPGMTEEIRKRIFEPFFTTKPVGIGTGLGLSVSYFIICEDHGGAMWVESEPGEGARFIIELPT